MRPWIPALSALLLITALVTVPPPAAHAADRAATTADGWPDTPAGRMAHGWVDAFNGGEAAMRGFLSRNLTAASLEKKPMSDRLAIYRTNHERFGRLVFGSVEKSAPAEVTVSLLDADANPFPFTFIVQPQAPYRLVSVSMKQMQGHGGFGFHH